MSELFHADGPRRGRRGTPAPNLSGVAAAPSRWARLTAMYLRWRLRCVDAALEDAEYSQTGMHPNGDVFFLTSQEQALLAERVELLRAKRCRLRNLIAAVERGGQATDDPSLRDRKPGDAPPRGSVDGRGSAGLGETVRLAEPRRVHYEIVREGGDW